MEHFEASGLWYTGDDPSKKVSGTLHYSSAGLNLRLIGGFSEGWRPATRSHGTLFGIVGDCPYGSFVTLFDGFVKGSRFRSVGIGDETIVATSAIIGDFHLADERPIETIGLRFSYLDDWTGGHRFGLAMPSGAGEDNFTITYLRPDLMVFGTPSEAFTVGFSVEADTGAHSAGLRERAQIVVKPANALNHGEIIGRYMKSIRDLVTFATDTPNGIDEVTLWAPKSSQEDLRNRVHFVFDPIFEVGKKEDRLVPGYMLFTLTESQAAGLNVFARWFEFSGRHDAFCTVYFAHQYAPPRYIDEEFSRLMSAFTLLCKSLAGATGRGMRVVSAVNAAVAELLVEEDRELLGHVIPVDYEVEMPFLLLDFLAEYADPMDQVIGGDRRDFVRSIMDTLGFVKRRSAGSQRPALRGQGMLDAIAVIQLLIKIMVLERLGFERSDAARFVRRNRAFDHLKTRVDAS